MVPSIVIITAAITVLQGLTFHVDAKSQPLCADKSGNFLGLAIDENSYESIPGSELIVDDKDVDPNDRRSPKSSPVQQWTMTEEGSTGPKNSYGGKYLQVLPDIGRTYPGGHGKHLKSVIELEGDSPYLSFQLRVKKGGEGWHTLFVRWTGGDTIGGGDSFYVVMKQKEGIVPGERTIKPAVVPIDSKIITYAGCCYDHLTHACPCYHEKPDEAACSDRDFLTVERAITFDKQCVVGQGVMDIIKAPQWYLFSGQEDGNIMDFADEPWDTTCEANGSSTADSAHDFPSWYLEKGDYELQIYAREDGTAFDGIYIAGPDGGAPGLPFSHDGSTLCSRTSRGGLKTIGIVLVVGMCLAGLVAFLTITDQGQEVTHQGKLMINRAFYSNSAQDTIRQYEQMEQLEVS